MLMHLKMSRKLLSAVGLATIWTAPSLVCRFGTAAKPNTLALFLTQQRCWAQHLCSVPAPVLPFYSQALWKWVPFPLNPSTVECWVWSAFLSPVSHTGTKGWHFSSLLYLAAPQSFLESLAESSLDIWESTNTTDWRKRNASKQVFSTLLMKH